jgi:hypothetical protein
VTRLELFVRSRLSQQLCSLASPPPSPRARAVPYHGYLLGYASWTRLQALRSEGAATGRQRVLVWVRLVALAIGMHAAFVGATDDDDAWRQLRGVTYVRRAVAEGLRIPTFPMLRNQACVGGVDTYWVTLVAGGLVEDDSGALTARGEAIADAFLKHQATPERGKLHRLLAGDDVTFTEPALIEWGSVAHLGAASKREQTLRFKSLWPIVAAP